MSELHPDVQKSIKMATAKEIKKIQKCDKLKRLTGISAEYSDSAIR